MSEMKNVTATEISADELGKLEFRLGAIRRRDNGLVAEYWSTDEEYLIEAWVPAHVPTDGMRHTFTGAELLSAIIP